MLSLIKKIIYPVYILYAYLLFVVGLLIIFPGVLVALLLGQPAGGNLVIKLSRAWSDGWLLLIGIEHKNIVEEPIQPKRHYVFVANHISYLDIPLIFQAIRKNPIRVLGKIEMSKIPVFGLLYQLAVVLIDRSSNISRADSIVRLKQVLDKNISIFIFPEGTFNEGHKPLKHFYDGAFRMAIETQTPIKPIVYLDSVNRMHYKSIFSLTPGISRAVILPEIDVTSYTIADVGLLKQNTFDAMEACIILYGGHFK
jgi:1-acyl-sn-glycerol-3-phosphate acyltransferase